jgi:hypothetical protein
LKEEYWQRIFNSGVLGKRFCHKEADVTGESYMLRERLWWSRN